MESSTLDRFEVRDCGKKALFDCWRRDHIELGASAAVCSEFGRTRPTSEMDEARPAP
jgi:hypothetical protein